MFHLSISGPDKGLFPSPGLQGPKSLLLCTLQDHVHYSDMAAKRCQRKAMNLFLCSLTARSLSWPVHCCCFCQCVNPNQPTFIHRRDQITDSVLFCFVLFPACSLLCLFFVVVVVIVAFVFLLWELFFVLLDSNPRLCLDQNCLQCKGLGWCDKIAQGASSGQSFSRGWWAALSHCTVVRKKAGMLPKHSSLVGSVHCFLQHLMVKLPLSSLEEWKLPIPGRNHEIR